MFLPLLRQETYVTRLKTGIWYIGYSPVILLLVVVLHWTLDSCCAWCSTKGYGFLVLAVPGLAGMETGLLLTYLQGRGNGSCSPLPGFKSSTGKHDMALKFRKIYTIWEKHFRLRRKFFSFYWFWDPFLQSSCCRSCISIWTFSRLTDTLSLNLYWKIYEFALQ